MRLPYQVVVYPYRMQQYEPEFLLLLRNKIRGGFWQGISGGVETGENFKSAAERELKEETRLNPMAISEIDFSYTFPIDEKWKYLYSDDDTIIQEHAFIARVDINLNPKLSAEHVAFRWCAFEEALSLLK